MDISRTSPDRPAVSIVVPAHDVAPYVAQTVDSIARQSFADWELIVVDDGSTDGTGAILKRLASQLAAGGQAMTLVAQTNTGAAAARNAGLRRARGRYVVFVDADDRVHPDLLARLVAQLDAEPTLDAVFPRYDYIDAAGRRLGFTSRPPKARFDMGDILRRNPMHSATGVMVRRSATQAAGFFDEALRATIDLDYWVRVAALRSGNFGCVDAVLVEYRRRDGQITSDWRRMRTGWLRVREKAVVLAPELAPSLHRSGYANRCIYWSTLAYAAGDYAAARQLAVTALLASPRTFMADDRAMMHAAVCLASLLPRRLHEGLRDGYRGFRGRILR